jgi:hypothetical protein
MAKRDPEVDAKGARTDPQDATLTPFLDPPVNARRVLLDHERELLHSGELALVAHPFTA